MTNQISTAFGPVPNALDLSLEQIVPLRVGLHKRDLQLFGVVVGCLFRAPKEAKTIGERVCADRLATARLKGLVRELVEEFNAAEKGLFPPSRNEACFRAFLERVLSGDGDFLRIAQSASLKKESRQIRTNIQGIDSARVIDETASTISLLDELS